LKNRLKSLNKIDNVFAGASVTLVPNTKRGHKQNAHASIGSVEEWNRE
jgi:hypothetical protein